MRKRELAQRRKFYECCSVIRQCQLLGWSLAGFLTIVAADRGVAEDAVKPVEPTSAMATETVKPRKSNPFDSGWYIAGYGGVTFPEKVTSVRGTGTTVIDLNLTRSVIGGAKLGYYFESIKWVGLELDVFYTAPNAAQQRVAALRTGRTFNSTAAGSNLQVVTTALNVLVRYPGEWFQPYLGAGPALVYAREQDPLLTQTDALRFGVNAVAGSRFLVTQRLWLFAEYKWDYAQLPFDSVRATSTQSVRVSGSYATHNAVLGIGISF